MTADDRINARILQELQRNARQPNTELAARVGLSPSACLRRVQELERRGIISGYRAIIAPDARNVGFVAYVTVGLSQHSNDAQRAFERACIAAPAVRECHNITGTVEYLLRVELTDLAAYKQFHADVLGAFPWIARITTHVVMSSPKDERA
ncbi:Lrp/AsnC family transcriptional regulator [Paracoccus fistulariae]|uniref:Lrp/AsnC family transcriptional regulator n=1 Tax=Paracoccus fistulariae TaxID=658446 RepID=A0ABY7SKU7_9RHOB|nr:Lrp/AsnC family transcriptional regulator [Paracoccus fistulariae]MDB6181390.1 Lrp/AsnC family transcriptional regulator [Paracoccus fistulariae]WCR07436.1 Lrp/AsnC family transcriptional regulator [Paracoccus fistulariae]